MRKILLFTTALLSFWGQAKAAETEISIYNENLALINKSQKADLRKGINEVVFDEVAQELKPESAFIFGDDVQVLEQNYDYAGISYQSLLTANIGKKVKTVRQNPSTGANIFEEATLVAVNGNQPVLQFDYGIESDFPGRVLFDAIPQELNSTPVLMARVAAKEAGAKDLNLAYLANGLSWRANYVAKVNDEETFSLLGRAAIVNNSGSSYENVTVNMVAGEVNTVQQNLQSRLMKNVRAPMMALESKSSYGAATIDAPSSMDSYYIYKIPFKTSLKNGQIKQISFLSVPKVKYQKEGVIYSSLYFDKAKNFYKDVHPAVYYRFVNNEEDGLGMPLPEGIISVYKPDDKGTLQFIGEQQIGNMAAGQKIDLNIGKYFDVYGEGKITDIKKIDEKKGAQDNSRCLNVATTYQYHVIYQTVNKSAEVVHLLIKQPLFDGAEIVSTTLEGKPGDGDFYEWRFDLNAGATKGFTAEIKNVINSQECGGAQPSL